MKVIMLNGSPHKNGCTYTGLSIIADTLKEQGIESEIIHVGSAPLAGCKGCAACRKLGKCVIDDLVNEVAAKLESADAIVIGSPVHYAATSGQITTLCHRLFYSAGSKLKNKPGCAIVSCRRGGASAAFDQLNKYFAINNMPIVTSSYWNQIHGNTPEEVLKDEEGLQTMRTLGVNMAWLLKCISAGKAAGISTPNYEEKIKTNFIR